MFDFSFGEIMLVGLVALVVLGPERLPKAARFVGLWVRRARAQWYSVKSELERELASEELRRSLADGQEVMREAQAGLRSADSRFRTELSDTAAEVRAPIAEPEARGATHNAEDDVPRLEVLPAALPVPTPSAPTSPVEDVTDTPRPDAHGG